MVSLKKEKENAIKKQHLLPGQKISADQYVSAVPGRLYTSRGSKSSKDKFCGGTIFVDHASGFIDVRHQPTLSATDTVKSKLEFETAADACGIKVKSYHTDNGVFTAKDFYNELLQGNQSLTLSGVGAAHQNAVAERAIKTVVNMARSMLLHAALRSPEGAITAEFWPMAMDHATWLYNCIPHMDTGFAPIQLWTQSSYMDTKHVLSCCHVWGCPAFVLEPKLQKPGVKIPKWAPRSRCGVNLGFSRLHSTLVGLILNPLSGVISPQFHVVYDDLFSTVFASDDTEESAELWEKLLTLPNNKLQVLLDQDDDPELEDHWLTDSELESKR